MTLPNRNNPYSFQPFLDWREQVDFYASDPFLQQVVLHAAGNGAAGVDAAARALSAKASYRWRDLATAISTPEHRPVLVHWDGHRNRVDRLVRPAQAEALEREVFGEALFSVRTDPLTRLVKMYLTYQNGEACTACPLVCTEGLVAILELFADRPETRAMLEHVKEGRDGEFALGAQFLSEVQGGSDVPANVVEAVEAGGHWRLYGNKFFCSVAHADYAVATAKPRGSEKVGLFAISLWAPGQFRQRRAGYTVDRIKWKLGTSELPTAEITLDGVPAYPLGPLDRGVANVVAVVLTLSRLTVGVASAAYMARGAREATAYAQFREAFGQPLADFPMVQNQLEDMNRTARRSTAGAFKIAQAFHRSGGLSGKVTDKRTAFDARELIMLQKFTASEESTDVLRTAMSIFGGHGVIEDFSCLPRLFRDSAVNEVWEGPRNVLQAQVHRDLQRAASWYRPADFVAHVLQGAQDATVRELGGEFTELVAHPSLTTPDAATRAACRRWDAVCRELLHAYQDVAVREVEAGSAPGA